VPCPGKVYPLRQALGFAAQKHSRGFHRWCRRYGVRPCSRGRYSGDALARGIEREKNGRRPR
jgi:hypothetical protein